MRNVLLSRVQSEFQIEMSKQQVHLGKQDKHSGKIKLRMDTMFMGFIEVYDIHRHFFANCAENIFLELFQDISKLFSKTPVLWSSELLIFMLNGQLNYLRINYRFQKITYSFVKVFRLHLTYNWREAWHTYL